MHALPHALPRHRIAASISCLLAALPRCCAAARLRCRGAALPRPRAPRLANQDSFRSKLKGSKLPAPRFGQGPSAAARTVLARTARLGLGAPRGKRSRPVLVPRSSMPRSLEADFLWDPFWRVFISSAHDCRETGFVPSALVLCALVRYRFMLYSTRPRRVSRVRPRSHGGPFRTSHPSGETCRSSMRCRAEDREQSEGLFRVLRLVLCIYLSIYIERERCICICVGICMYIR